jgi:membrane protein YdbS with pleckstrin-like domain
MMDLRSPVLPKRAPSDVLTAAFNPLIRPYLLLYVAAVLALTIVGIPLALVWLLGVGQWWAKHYFDRLSCELSQTELRFRKGILFQVEKTIPLENIQDVTFIEGPVLRQFNLSILKFETAGQSQGQAHDMQLIGIVNAHAFRQQILERRRALKQRSGPAAPSEAGVATSEAQAEQLQLLRRIAERLDDIAAALRKPGP